MKERGNECFKKGDYFDALWKYEHSRMILDALEHSPVPEMKAVVHSNIAACCLKLGDDDRIDLLHSDEGFPIHQIMWYGFSHHHADQSLALNPIPRVAQKVCCELL